jgi:hypothetical protein
MAPVVGSVFLLAPAFMALRATNTRGEGVEPTAQGLPEPTTP